MRAGRELGDVALLGVEHEQVVGAGPPVRAAVRRERDPAAVGVPGGVALVVGVVGEPVEPAGLRREHVEVGEAGPADGGEREAAVGRPRGRVDGDEPVEPVGRPHPAPVEVVRVDDVAVAALRDKGEPPVARDVHPALEVVERLEPVAPLAPHDDARLPRRPVRAVDGDAVDVRVARRGPDEQDAPLAVGGRVDGGLRREPLGGEAGRDERGELGVAEGGEVPAPHPVGEPAGDLGLGGAERVREHLAEVDVAPGVLDQREHLVLAVRLREEVEERLPLLVHEVRPRNPVEVVERDEVAGGHRVSHHHLVLVVALAAPVLGEPLGEPQREEPVGGRPVVLVGPEQLRVREDVDEFVADHPAEPLEVAVGGEDDAPLEELEEPADPVRDEPGRDVRLLEVDVGRVEDERRPAREAVGEAVLQLRVLLFGEGRPDLGERARLRVVVDVEVGRPEHLPVEALVLHLVAAEVVAVLAARGRREEHPHEGDERHERGALPHGTKGTHGTLPLKVGGLGATRPRYPRSGRRPRRRRRSTPPPDGGRRGPPAALPARAHGHSGTVKRR